MAYHRTQERLITAPTIEPVSLADVQQHLRIDSQIDSDYIQSLITVARMQLEQYCWSAFITQTWQYWWDRFWWKMFLPRGPIASGWNGTTNSGGVTWLKYVPPQGITAGPTSYMTVPTTVWETSAENGLTYIRAAYLQTYPITRGYRDDVTAQVVCGYGATAAAVPLPIRQAIKLLAAYFYANRGEIEAPIPKAIQYLIDPYRLKEW